MSLRVTVREAQLPPTESTRQYVSLRMGSSLVKTPPANSSNPQWNATFTFQAIGTTLRIELWSASSNSQELMGEGQLNLTKCYSKPYDCQDQSIDLVKNSARIGRVFLTVSYVGPPVSPTASNPYVMEFSKVQSTGNKTTASVGGRMIASTIVRGNSPTSLRAVDKPDLPVQQVPPMENVKEGSLGSYPSIWEYDKPRPAVEAIPRTSSYSQLPVENVPPARSPPPMPNNVPMRNVPMNNLQANNVQMNNFQGNPPRPAYNNNYQPYGYNSNGYSPNGYMPMNPQPFSPQMNQINNLVGNQMANSLGPPLPPGMNAIGLGLAMNVALQPNEWDINFTGRY